MAKGKILVVDDDALSRALCADILKSGGYSVSTAPSGEEAVEMVDDEEFDIVLTDLIMPDMDGIKVLEKVKQHNTLIDVVVVTGHGSIESAIDALKKGAFDYLRKPINEDELLVTVNNCIEKKKLLEENLEMRQSLKLFDVTRAVSNTLDINKLYNVTLDAILQIVPADAGILIFYDTEAEGLGIKAARHVDTKHAERVLKLFKERYEKDLKNLGNITVLSSSEMSEKDAEVFRGFSSIMVAPVMKGAEATGFILTLGRTSYSTREIKNAAFVAEHASSAFENAQRYVEAKEMAFIDSLTNLYNSKYLETALDKELKRADRLMMPVTVLFIDLDNFKQINDTNDHIIGSKVLIEVAKILLKSVREVDTVVRYGGDEYVVILIDADYNTGFTVADRIRAGIEEKDFLEEEGLGLRITASIGIATYPVHAKTRIDLLKIADKAMYRAKDISRNLVYLAPVPGAETAE